MQKIRDIESKAMTDQKPQPGLIALMEYLQSRGVRKGICTRNFDTPVNHLIEKFMKGHDFAPIM
jgi:phosphoglycolate phosphatase-like HAD superfamily hydrolase